MPAARNTPAPVSAPEGAGVLCPFTVVIDSREQKPYTFHGLTTNAAQRLAPLVVPTVRLGLPTGDYSIEGFHDPRGAGPAVLIERKSKEDLYASVGRRANFIGRLERMHAIAEAGGYCAVVVECNDVDLLVPPPHTRLHPKSLNRTILAWRQRYRVDWWFLSTRERAEAYTFRILERFYLDKGGK